jgi:hypothetical protein
MICNNKLFIIMNTCNKLKTYLINLINKTTFDLNKHKTVLYRLQQAV